MDAIRFSAIHVLRGNARKEFDDTWEALDVRKYLNNAEAKAEYNQLAQTYGSDNHRVIMRKMLEKLTGDYPDGYTREEVSQDSILLSNGDLVIISDTNTPDLTEHEKKFKVGNYVPVNSPSQAALSSFIQERVQAGTVINYVS